MNAAEIFQLAIELPSPAERDAYVASACGVDAALLEKVKGLLKAHAEAGSFLDKSLFANQKTLDLQPAGERPGSIIGPYKLLQQIGEGGMGVVFMAEQTHPVQRKVALKIIKPGMDSRLVIARFEAERQALAMMDHVNIARVLDGGTIASSRGQESGARGQKAGSSQLEAQLAPDLSFLNHDVGRPYFVMELINGVPITKYCDDNHLSPRERLELFIPVCQAIQHAHQKGIIHRDIKPSNVMITLYDGKPVPKVIDFGVAKAIEQKLTERTLFTQYGTMVGTLEYMSPEQAEMSALGVDTRSDIYSLGVLLYELLTGTTPLERKRLRTEAYAEILRIIKEEDPPRPSTRLSNSGEELASISAQRHMEPAKLTRLVRGELDWIVMKCLEKDRNRRYETANAFAMDVQCYLNDEPVHACPPSSWYRFRKFARRNKASLVAAAIISLVVLLGTGISIWQAIRATNAEHLTENSLITERQIRADLDKARDDKERQEKRINRELSETLIEVARLREIVGNRSHKETENLTQLRSAIKKAETLAENTLADSTLVQRARTAAAEMKQGDADRKMITRLEDIYLSKGSFHGDKLTTVSGGSFNAYMDAFKEYGLQITEKPAVEAIARKIAASSISELLVAALDDCASNERELCQRLLPIAQRVSNDPWRRKYFEARTHNDQPALLQLAKQPEAMEQPAATLCMLAQWVSFIDRTKAVELLRESQRRYPADLWLNHRLAEVLNNINAPNHEAYLRLRGEIVGFSRVALAARPDSPALHNQLAGFLDDALQYDEAIAVCRRSIQLKADNLAAYLILANCLRMKEKLNDALVAISMAIQIDPKSADAHSYLADILNQKGDKAAAIDASRRAISLEPKLEHLQRRFGHLLVEMKDYDGAIAAYRKAIELDPSYPGNHRSLGDALAAKGKKQEAIAAYRKAIDSEQGDGEVSLSLGNLLVETGKPDEAIVVFQNAIKRNAYSAYYHGLGTAYQAKGDLPAAEKAFQEARRLDPNFAQNHYSYAWISLAMGNRLAYRRACVSMVDQLEKEDDPDEAWLIVKACLPIADSIPDMKQLIPLAEIAGKEKQYLHILAATLYRTDKYKEALAKFNEAVAAASLTAWDQLFLAMTHHRLGQADKARDAFNKAITLSETNKYPWPESDELKHLRREAEELLKQK